MSKSCQRLACSRSVQRCGIPEFRETRDRLELIVLAHGMPAKELAAFIGENADRGISLFKVMQQSLKGYIRQDLARHQGRLRRLWHIAFHHIFTVAARSDVFAVHVLKDLLFQIIGFSTVKIVCKTDLFPGLNRCHGQFIAG